MSRRPEITLVPIRTDRMLFCISAAILVLIILSAGWIYNAAPESVPAHFSISGKPDRYGSRMIIFLIPGLSVLFFTGLTLLSKYPQHYNYPVKVTDENAASLYAKGKRMIVLLNLGLMALMLLLEIEMYKGIKDNFLPMKWWEIPLILLLTIGIPVYVSLKTFSSEKRLI